MAGLPRAIAALLLLVAHVAHAGTGLTQIARPDAGPVTIFYPTAAPDQDIRRGPFNLRVAPDAAAAQGNGRLVVISHGSGGNPWTHSDLARALVAAGFTVAMPQHKGDNASDPSRPGPASWKLRPAEVSAAIDAVAADARFTPLLRLDAVGVYGMSAGGHTALSMAGGRWSQTRLRDHCVAHIGEDFASCVGLTARLDGDALDEVKKAIAVRVIRQRLTDDAWQAHDEPRVRAVVAGVPFAVDFEPASLAQPRVPLGIVQARQDKWLPSRFHSGPVLAACLPRCELLADLPTAGHGALLSPMLPQELMGDTLRALIADPPGFDRAQMRDVDQRIVQFFERHLAADARRPQP